MARTARQLAALGVTMAVAMSGSNTTSLSKGLGQDEFGIELDGKKLFDKETFGGNGRTCLTCHSKNTGTLTLADVQRIIEKADPDDTFLIHDAAGLNQDGAMHGLTAEQFRNYFRRGRKAGYDIHWGAAIDAAEALFRRESAT